MALVAGRADVRTRVGDQPVRSADHHPRLVAALEEPGTIGLGTHFDNVIFGAGSAGRQRSSDQ